MPSILFSHQNYPAQFGGFGRFLAARGWDVTFATARADARAPAGCRLLPMKPHRSPTTGVHRYATGLEKAMINGQAFANAAIRAREREGLRPDIVVAHSGWGSGTFCKAVWPECRYAAYVEWFYRWPSVDVADGEAAGSVEDRRAHALARNAPTLLDLAEADLVFCPTEFQARRFPEGFRRNMIVQHDGVETRKIRPNRRVGAAVAGRLLPPEAEIVTYATRGMEPHRGFPDFIRAVAALQKLRPRLHAVIAGEDRVAYGPPLPAGESWKGRMLAEADLDMDRVHFVGTLPHARFVELLQAAHAHVYFTVPFVLSWSVIEAMSAGCPLVASDNAAVREALTDGRTALLVDHRDIAATVAAVSRLLDDRALALHLGDGARREAVQRFDAGWIWPAREECLRRLIAPETAAPAPVRQGAAPKAAKAG